LSSFLAAVYSRPFFYIGERTFFFFLGLSFSSFNEAFFLPRTGMTVFFFLGHASGRSSVIPFLLSFFFGGALSLFFILGHVLSIAAKNHAAFQL